MTLAFLGDRESQPKPLFATVIGVGVTRSKGSCHYHSSISNRSTSVSMRFWITSYIDCIQYSHEKNHAFRTWKDVSPFYLLRWGTRSTLGEWLVLMGQMRVAMTAMGSKLPALAVLTYFSSSRSYGKGSMTYYTFGVISSWCLQPMDEKRYALGASSAAPAGRTGTLQTKSNSFLRFSGMTWVPYEI